MACRQLLLPSARGTGGYRRRPHSRAGPAEQERWESELLPVPVSVLLDPLLIGEKREGFRSRYFLIDQFELTKAEDYLVSEFLRNPD